MADTGLFELSAITGGTGAVRSDDVLPLVDVHDSTQAAQGSTVKITLAQFYRTETTAVTVSTPLPDIAQKWNAGGVTFTAVKLNVTDTASAAGSLLIDLQVGAASKFSVTKAGAVTMASTLTVTTGGVTVSAGTTAVQALTVALQATLNGTAAQIGAFFQLSATATSIAWQAGNNTGNGFKWIHDESVTGNAMLVRINAGVDAVMMTFTRASGLVTLAAGLTVAGAVAGVTTLNTSGLATLGAGIALTGSLTFATAVSKIVPGATSISLRNNADSADNILVTDAGLATVRAGVTLTAGALTFGAAAAKIVPGATSISHRNNADSADNLIILDDGTATHRANVYIGAGPISAIATAYGNAATRVLTVYDASGTLAGTLELGGTLTADGTVGRIAFNNAAINGIGVGNNRLGQIFVERLGANNSSDMVFQTYSAGTAKTALVLDTNGKAVFFQASTATASANLPHGAAPASPVNGDIWTTTAGLFVRINGATVGPLT